MQQAVKTFTDFDYDTQIHMFRGMDWRSKPEIDEIVVMNVPRNKQTKLYAKAVISKFGCRWRYILDKR